MVGIFIIKSGQQCDQMFMNLPVEPFERIDFFLESFAVFLLESLDREEPASKIDLINLISFSEPFERTIRQKKKVTRNVGDLQLSKSC